MNYAERLSNVSVLGAGGKMGSGIALLTAIEMAELSLQPENSSRQFVLNAVDVSSQALAGLLSYLRSQVQKDAEKNIVRLRKLYESRTDLVENREIIDQYVQDVLRIVRPSTAVEPAFESSLIFEAVIEDADLKAKVLTKIDRNNPAAPWYFSNTSSIPIHELDQRVELGGRIIGFHFYNPPAVQKLVELIPARTTRQELQDFARSYAKNLRKTIVPANDFAGFIGNGFFMRDILHAVAEVQRLAAGMPLVEAVYAINKVSQDYLVRPMGSFQLIDYVGLDVSQLILKVMKPYYPDESLHSPMLDRYMELKVKGGQHPDGSQKDGFLKYEKNRPSAVYDPDRREYVPLSAFQAGCDQKLGPLPKTALPWKAAISHPAREQALSAMFAELRDMDTQGAQLAMAYGARAREIGLKLVSSGVALSEADVNTVMLTGFFHAYGPINSYFER
jgi:3-hydroxyacyl-CoA dehydrogenase